MTSRGGGPATVLLLACLALSGLLACASQASGGGGAHPAGCQAQSRPPFTVPSLKGLNYGTPNSITGEYLGLEWLRRGRGDDSPFQRSFPALQADLAFIRQHGLGRLMRLFLALDQAMVWDDRQGFTGFDGQALDNFQQTLDLFDSQGMKLIVVLFDEEEQGTGTFRAQALDGRHDAMRAGYLRGLDAFLRRFGGSPVVVGWDLFNEAYNSLGRDGGQQRPGYSTETVHAWVHDLYTTARCAAPRAWFTVSDTTELYWKQRPDLSKLEDSVDFYDVHVYDDHPRLPDWRSLLHKPYLIGESGADIEGNHYRDQSINPRVVGYLLQHAREAGLTAVLAHSADGNVYPPDRSDVTATGRVIAEFAG